MYFPASNHDGDSSFNLIYKLYGEVSPIKYPASSGAVSILGSDAVVDPVPIILNPTPRSPFVPCIPCGPIGPIGP